MSHSEKIKHFTLSLSLTAVGCGWLTLVAACTSPSDLNEKHPGETLARAHCGSCHQFAEPALLDQTTWQEDVLPVMGLHLGLLDAPSPAARQNLQTLLLEGNYPTQPQLSMADWEKIKAYYQADAPAQLDLPTPVPLPLTDRFVEREVPVSRSAPPGITCVRIDTLTHRLYAADAGVQTLFDVDPFGGEAEAILQQPTVSALTWVGPQRELLATHLGFSVQPKESAEGYVSMIEATAPWLSALARPTQTLTVDLSGDATEELLTCNFGYRTGRLSYWKRGANSAYQEVVLKDEPGALMVEVRDLTGNGRNDVVALFAQADEKLVRYDNQGDGQFRERVLLQFPASYGSTSFELHDFNGDGHLDVLYTGGDNADHSMILKPYHGVYLFLNQGDWTFEQAYFFPMHGAYRAMARDYDQDGDLDIAAIAFFADYEQQPERGFVYLENQGDLGFVASTRPIHTAGRWITMDANDLDGDRDDDIVLGSYTVGPPFGTTVEGWKKQSGVLWLENTTTRR